MFCGECGRAVVATEAPAAPIAPAPIAAPPAAAASAVPAAHVPPLPVAFSAAEAASEDPVDHVGAARPAAVCPQCGTAVDEDEVFCGECGFVLRTVPPPALVSERLLEPMPEPVPDLRVAPMPPPVERSPGPSAPSGPSAPDMSATDLVPALEPDLELSIERAPRPDPFPWGLPRAGVEDLEATRLTADPLAGRRFVLQFSTGENVTISGAGLIGRNPVAQPGEVMDQLIAVFDPTKSVSKTHLEFGQEAGRFWVSDRFSTNGSVVRQPDAEPRRCEPGRRYFVARGTRIDIGEQFFVVS
jgi:hypothetical protein